MGNLPIRPLRVREAFEPPLTKDELLTVIDFLLKQLGGSVSIDWTEVAQMKQDLPRVSVYQYNDPYRLVISRGQRP